MKQLKIVKPKTIEEAVEMLEDFLICDIPAKSLWDEKFIESHFEILKNQIKDIESKEKIRLLKEIAKTDEREFERQDKTLKAWIEANWGRRCRDFDVNCALCQAWNCFDKLRLSESKEPLVEGFATQRKFRKKKGGLTR